MGKEGSEVNREILAFVYAAIGTKFKVMFSRLVQVDIKADKFDTRILVLTEHRLFILTYKQPIKVETNVHILDLSVLDMKEPRKLKLGTESKRLVISPFCSIAPGTEPAQVDAGAVGDRDMEGIVAHIFSTFARIFTALPIQKLIPCLELPAGKTVTEFLIATQGSGGGGSREPGPCGNYSAIYLCMCDYHGVDFMEDVAWDVDTIYLSQDCKELMLADFDHVLGRNLTPIISSLWHNTWFTVLNASNVKLSADLLNEILTVVKNNTIIEELLLSNISIRPEFLQKLSVSLSSNSLCSLNVMDLSQNILIEDKGLGHLSGPLAKLPRGLVALNLAHIGATARGINQLCGSLLTNKTTLLTLTRLDLSGNSLRGDDLTHLHTLLSQSVSLTHLRLASCDCPLETLFGALLRGCIKNLTYLDLSSNIYNIRRPGKEISVPNAWKQFFISSAALKTVRFANNKLPLEAVKSILLGIGSNATLRDVDLDLSGNGLGSTPAACQMLEACLPNIHNIVQLDISDNALDASLAGIVSKLTATCSIRRLAIGRNFVNIKPKHITVVLNAVVEMIQYENSMIESLSLNDLHLKADTTVVINALGSNTTLTEIDISGNQMGDMGARMLAKALQINKRLSVIHWDDNSTSPSGFSDIARALEKNYTVRKMPVPIRDASAALEKNPEKTTQALQKIEALLQRNHAPRKFAVEEAYRLQHGFLVSSIQQSLDRTLVDLQTTINGLEKFAEGGGNLSGDTLAQIDRAKNLIKDSNASCQLLLQLQKIAECEERGENSIVSERLKSLADELNNVVNKQLRLNVDGMVQCVKSQCPNVSEYVPEHYLPELQTECSALAVLPERFILDLVCDQLGTDISNKTSELNLRVTAHICDTLTDAIIEALEKTAATLSQVLKAHLISSGQLREGEVMKGLITGGVQTATSLNHAKKLVTTPITAVTITASTTEPEDHHQAVELSEHSLAEKTASHKSLYQRRLRPQSTIVSCCLSDDTTCSPALKSMTMPHSGQLLNSRERSSSLADLTEINTPVSCTAEYSTAQHGGSLLNTPSSATAQVSACAYLTDEVSPAAECVEHSPSILRHKHRNRSDDELSDQIPLIGVGDDPIPKPRKRKTQALENTACITISPGCAESGLAEKGGSGDGGEGVMEGNDVKYVKVQSPQRCNALMSELGKKLFGNQLQSDKLVVEEDDDYDNDDSEANRMEEGEGKCVGEDDEGGRSKCTRKGEGQPKKEVTFSKDIDDEDREEDRAEEVVDKKSKHLFSLKIKKDKKKKKGADVSRSISEVVKTKPDVVVRKRLQSTPDENKCCESSKKGILESVETVMGGSTRDQDNARGLVARDRDVSGPANNRTLNQETVRVAVETSSVAAGQKKDGISPGGSPLLDRPDARPSRRGAPTAPSTTADLPLSHGSAAAAGSEGRHQKGSVPHAPKPTVPAMSLDLPVLTSEVPKLEHLGKDRPRRVKTKAMTRPAVSVDGLGDRGDAEDEEDEFMFTGRALGAGVKEGADVGGASGVVVNGEKVTESGAEGGAAGGKKSKGLGALLSPKSDSKPGLFSNLFSSKKPATTAGPKTEPSSTAGKSSTLGPEAKVTGPSLAAEAKKSGSVIQRKESAGKDLKAVAADSGKVGMVSGKAADASIKGAADLGKGAENPAKGAVDTGKIGENSGKASTGNALSGSNSLRKVAIMPPMLDKSKPCHKSTEELDRISHRQGGTDSPPIAFDRSSRLRKSSDELSNPPRLTGSAGGGSAFERNTQLRKTDHAISTKHVAPKPPTLSEVNRSPTATGETSTTTGDVVAAARDDNKGGSMKKMMSAGNLPPPRPSPPKLGGKGPGETEAHSSSEDLLQADKIKEPGKKDGAVTEAKVAAPRPIARVGLPGMAPPPSGATSAKHSNLTEKKSTDDCLKTRPPPPLGPKPSSLKNKGGNQSVGGNGETTDGGGPPTPNSPSLSSTRPKLQPTAPNLSPRPAPRSLAVQQMLKKFQEDEPQSSSSDVGQQSTDSKLDMLSSVPQKQNDTGGERTEGGVGETSAPAPSRSDQASPPVGDKRSSVREKAANLDKNSNSKTDQSEGSKPFVDITSL